MLFADNLQFVFFPADFFHFHFTAGQQSALVFSRWLARVGHFKPIGLFRKLTKFDNDRFPLKSMSCKMFGTFFFTFSNFVAPDPVFCDSSYFSKVCCFFFPQMSPRSCFKSLSLNLLNPNSAHSFPTSIQPSSMAFLYWGPLAVLNRVS